MNVIPVIINAITTRSVNALQLNTGLKVTALIKANEVFLIHKSKNSHQ
jgi:molybdopterin-binding protein